MAVYDWDVTPDDVVAHIGGFGGRTISTALYDSMRQLITTFSGELAAYFRKYDGDAETVATSGTATGDEAYQLGRGALLDEVGGRVLSVRRPEEAQIHLDRAGDQRITLRALLAGARTNFAPQVGPTATVRVTRLHSAYDRRLSSEGFS